ncbi:acyltransferase [Gardnerella vaginalis]|uniref:Acyltransferase n=1 Tax=Gardnerella vaginalis TaxID=2702 RepID=A0A133NUX7_GARVA|nr:acyltransferase family protein [Gardnerella vaginalis]KXA20092.1 acyltransferase [Gardnerella vaginalis]
MTEKRRVNTSTVSLVNQTPNKTEVSTENNASKARVSQEFADTSSTQKQSSSVKRNPAIDGLRALAIIGIICFHMRPSTLAGGFLGVTLFLVLAGYFCTRAVLNYLNANKNEKAARGGYDTASQQTQANQINGIKATVDNTANTINSSGNATQKTTHYWQYIWHRIQRIWPPTLGIIAITAPSMWLVSPSLLPKLQADALPGVSFFSNVMYVIRKLSYFEQSGLPSPIKHLWYLGLIMQAFIVWPLVLTVLVKFVHNTVSRMYITACLVILSSALTITFAHLFGNYTTPARVYYSLDTRASEFLLGAMLAMYGAWFAKHSLHEWLIRLWYWLRGNKQVTVISATATYDINRNNPDSANTTEQVFTDVTQAAIKEGIPEDLREGLQIDFSQNATTAETSDLRELPDNVFNKPKTVLYNPLHPWQRSCIGLMATIILCYCFVYADGTSSVFTFGGYTLTAAACTLILWSCTQTDNICSRLFAWKPLAYLGKRSFAIYLVHFPILELCNPATRTTAISWWEQLLQIAIIIVIAECFYQLFEKPLKNQHLLKIIRYIAITLCCFILIALIALPINWNSIAQQRSIQLRPELTTATIQPSEQNKNHTQQTQSSSKERDVKGVRKNIAKQSLPPVPSPYRVLFPIAEKVPQNLAASHTRINKQRNTCSVNLTMVGDSITEGAKPYLLQVMPNAFIDGKVSRQIFHGADEYEQDIASKHAGDVVIFALGTNGPPRDDSVLQRMVDAAKGKPVYFVTTRVPQPWQDVTNEHLRKFAATHSNVGIIDWHGFSEGHSEYLTDDGVHLTPVGGPQYAKMIRLALCGA